MTNASQPTVRTGRVNVVAAEVHERPRTTQEADVITQDSDPVIPAEIEVQEVAEEPGEGASGGVEGRLDRILDNNQEMMKRYDAILKVQGNLIASSKDTKGYLGRMMVSHNHQQKKLRDTVINTGLGFSDDDGDEVDELDLGLAMKKGEKAQEEEVSILSPEINVLVDGEWKTKKRKIDFKGYYPLSKKYQRRLEEFPTAKTHYTTAEQIRGSVDTNVLREEKEKLELKMDLIKGGFAKETGRTEYLRARQRLEILTELLEHGSAGLIPPCPPKGELRCLGAANTYRGPKFGAKGTDTSVSRLAEMLTSNIADLNNDSRIKFTRQTLAEEALRIFDNGMDGAGGDFPSMWNRFFLALSGGISGYTARAQLQAIVASPSNKTVAQKAKDIEAIARKWVDNCSDVTGGVSAIHVEVVIYLKQLVENWHSTKLRDLIMEKYYQQQRRYDTALEYFTVEAGRKPYLKHDSLWFGGVPVGLFHPILSLVEVIRNDEDMKAPGSALGLERMKYHQNQLKVYKDKDVADTTKKADFLGGGGTAAVMELELSGRDESCPALTSYPEAKELTGRLDAGDETAPMVEAIRTMDIAAASAMQESMEHISRDGNAKYAYDPALTEDGGVSVFAHSVECTESHKGQATTAYDGAIAKVAMLIHEIEAHRKNLLAWPVDYSAKKKDFSRTMQGAELVKHKYLNAAEKAGKEDRPYICFYCACPIDGGADGLKEHREKWCLYRGNRGFSDERCTRCYGWHETKCRAPAPLPSDYVPSKALLQSVPFVILRQRELKEAGLNL